MSARRVCLTDAFVSLFTCGESFPLSPSGSFGWKMHSEGDTVPCDSLRDSELVSHGLGLRYMHICVRSQMNFTQSGLYRRGHVSACLALFYFHLLDLFKLGTGPLVNVELRRTQDPRMLLPQVSSL